MNSKKQRNRLLKEPLVHGDREQIEQLKKIHESISEGIECKTSEFECVKCGTGVEFDDGDWDTFCTCCGLIFNIETNDKSYTYSRYIVTPFKFFYNR